MKKIQNKLIFNQYLEEGGGGGGAMALSSEHYRFMTPPLGLPRYSYTP